MAALAVGLLAPAEARAHARAGTLAALEPLLLWLGRARVDLRAALACLAFGLLALATDDALSDLPLTLAFAGGAALLGLAGRRYAELRLLPFALGAAALAAVHALVVDARLLPSLYPELSAGASGALGLAAAAAALGLCAMLLPRRQRGVTWLGRLDGVERHLHRVTRRHAAVRPGLAGATCAFGLAAAAVALAMLGEAGHALAVVLWCATGLAAVLVATPRGRWLVVVDAAGVLLVAALAKAVGYDWPELGADQGAAEALVCASAILLAGFAVRARSSSRAPLTIVSAVAAAIATVTVPIAVEELIVSDRLGGVAMLVVALAYVVLAAVAQRRPPLRNLATTMWVPGVLALILSEALLIQGRPIVVAYAATAVGLAWAGLRIRESRLVTAALALLGATALVTVAVLTPPAHLLEASASPGKSFWALAACAVACAVIAALVGGRAGRRLGWIAGGTGVYVVSLVIRELAQRLSTASVQTDFERGHTAVSALWGLIGLGLLVTGLLRRTQALRLGGLVLFGVSLAKLFLYELSTLSSITRAFSFIAVGALLLTGGFFLQRLGARLDEGAGDREPVTTR